MKTTGPLFICWSLLALVVNTGFLCYPDSGVNESPPPTMYTLEGGVTYPDGTPIDSARVHADNGAYTAEAYTNAAGYYKLTGLAQGINTVWAVKGTNDLVGGVHRVDCQSNQVLDLVIFRRLATSIQSDDRYRLSLRRYPLADLHFGTPESCRQVHVVFWVPNEMNSDSMDSWTAYKIPLGMSWPDVTIATLESSGTPKIQVNESTVRAYYANTMLLFPDDYPFVVPAAFFQDCANGIAFVSRVPIVADGALEWW